MTPLPLFSVVIPVKNGGKLIENCLKSLHRLNYPKNKLEIIIADGRSTDDTQKTARRLKAKIIDNPKGLVVSGRNLGFLAATGDFIAFSDADCTFDKNWLKNSLKYFQDPQVGGVSGPNLIPSHEKPFGRAVGLIFNMAYFFGAGSPSGQHRQVIKSRSHGSNAIYRRSALQQALPVDESIVEGEDVVMTQAIENAGYKLLYVPDVKVIHFRRSTPDRWLNQMMRYAQAKVLLKRKRIKNTTLIQTLTGFSIPWLILLVIVSFLLPPLRLPLSVISLFAILVAFTFSLFRSKSIFVAFNFVYACIIMIFAWSIGFLKESFFGSGQKWNYK